MREMNIINILGAPSADKMSVGDAALFAVIGFLLVVAIIAVMMGVLYGTGFLFKQKFMQTGYFGVKIKERRDLKKVGEVSEQDAESELLAEEELVAVLTAAIAAVYESEYASENAEPLNSDDFVDYMPAFRISSIRES